MISYDFSDINESIIAVSFVDTWRRASIITQSLETFTQLNCNVVHVCGFVAVQQFPFRIRLTSCQVIRYTVFNSV